MNTIPLPQSQFLSNAQKDSQKPGYCENVHKILQKFQGTLSNSRQVQTKKCPGKPGKDEFASIKEKQ
jgi:hypothetical protein